MTDPAEAAAQRAWDRVDLEIELERHQPVVRMDDGRIGGCQCMDRVFYLGYEDWSTHLADVVEQHALAAACEALAPLKELYLEEAQRISQDEPLIIGANRAVIDFLNRLYPLIYSDAELNPEGTTP